MTLLRPGIIKSILNISILSRVIVIVIQLISNLLIKDHEAGAYRNRYHLLLENNNATSIRSILPNSYLNAYRFVQGFTKWDAQYFLEISKDGYSSEQQLAFLPFYPITISLIRQTIFDHGKINFNQLIPSSSRYTLGSVDKDISVRELEIYIQNSIVGFGLNNFILFPIACLFLFMLTKLVKSNDEKYAMNVVWLFCFNPASVFFSACYSESTYAVMTFIALFTIEYRAKYYLATYQTIESGSKILSQLNRLLYTTLPALAPLALATATRSNGLVNIGFIAYQLLLKYTPTVSSRRQIWSFLDYICLTLEFIQDLLVLFMSAVFAAAGYISFQIYSYIKFCAESQSEKGSMTERPEWCNKPLPHPYGQVQAKFWNVGLFKYYELKQLPNFMLAAPITFIIMKGSLAEAKIISRARDKRLLAYYVHSIFLCLICSVTINIQVITRLIASSSPAFYWICVDMTRNSRTVFKLIRLYFIVYFIMGTILHVNFLPWT